jgi:chromosome segregation ATPase
MTNVRSNEQTLRDVAKVAKEVSTKKEGYWIGTYAQVMLALRKAQAKGSAFSMKIDKSDLEFSPTARLTKETSQTEKAFNETTNRFAETVSGISNAMGILSNTNRDTFTALSTELVGINGLDIAPLAKTRSELGNEIKDFLAEKNRVISEIDQALQSRSDKKAVLEQYKKQLEDLKNKHTLLSNRVKSLAESEKKVQRNLDTLYKKAFNALPPESRGNIPLPKDQEKTARRLT